MDYSHYGDGNSSLIIILLGVLLNVSFNGNVKGRFGEFWACDFFCHKLKLSQKALTLVCTFFAVLTFIKWMITILFWSSGNTICYYKTWTNLKILLITDSQCSSTFCKRKFHPYSFCLFPLKQWNSIYKVFGYENKLLIASSLNRPLSSPYLSSHKTKSRQQKAIIFVRTAKIYI